jgi:hypothetical protein
MSKRKADQIAGYNLWDLEIEDWINHCGLHPNDARAWTILRWMYWGNLRPLAAAIRARQPLNDVVLGTLAEMIDEDRLRAKPHGGGAPFRPGKSTRDSIAAAFRERLVSQGKTPAEADRLTAALIRRSEESVRKAVTRSRKSGKKVLT